MIADLVAKRRQAEEEAISLQANLDEAQKLHHDLATAYERFVNEREQMQDQAKNKKLTRSSNKLNKKRMRSSVNYVP